MFKRSLSVTALALSLSIPALGDANVQQKTRVQFGGFLGGVVNVFGGKAAREGVTSTSAVKGDRMLTGNERTAELVDLSDEKLYRIDYGRKSYSVVTFDELRRQLEEAKKEAAEEAEESNASQKKEEGPEYEVDFNVRETGEKQTINGFNTKQVIVTATVREKGKKLEQSGGAVLTADLWMGPKVPALREVAAFQQKYFKQLYGDSLAEMQQMAILMATQPTFAKAMKEFGKKRSSFEGDAIRTTLTFETVAAPGEAQEDDGGDAGLVGGLLRSAMKRRQARKGEEAAPGRTRLFESTTELLAASENAGDVSVPAGFKQK